MNNPLVPTPERRERWWECTHSGCDHVVSATVRPEPHDEHPRDEMELLHLPRV